MTEPPPQRVDVHVGDVSRSQLVIGDHNTIQTPKGTEVTVLQVGERPVPRLRATPLHGLPKGEVELVGRAEELRLAASAAAGAPVQLYAPDGTGKTALLKLAARQPSTPPEGVVLRGTRRRTLDDVRAELYTAFWECDVPFLPGPAEVGGYLADRQALLVLDDCELDRDDLGTLLDSVPSCAVVIASPERTLWSRGEARALPRLGVAAGVELLERELGRPIEAEERPAAETVVARLDGHPQSLVEAAALIADLRASLRELADEPAALERRLDPSALSGSQRSILEVLAALGNAPLGVEHVSELASVTDAERQLDELERRGWVKSASPRYRLVRTIRGFAGPSETLVAWLLDHLTRWSRDASPGEVAEEADALEASLALATGVGRPKEGLALSLAAEPKLAVSGAWTSWQNVLTSGLSAARDVKDEAAEAHLLHQLGSRSLCLGAEEQAVSQLTEALGIRERIDPDGAELTRHNLNQIGGGGGIEPVGDGGGGPWPPGLGVVLSALGVIAAAVIAIVVATGGDGGEEADPTGPTTEATTTEPTTDATTTTTTATEPEPGEPPEIFIKVPADGATYAAEESPVAIYECIPAEGATVTECEGSVGLGEPIDMTPGPHQFTVTAIDDTGSEVVETHGYTASEPEVSEPEVTEPPKTEPPSVPTEPPASPIG